jgi:branched-chain amino acid transport system substrate-binding protein
MDEMDEVLVLERRELFTVLSVTLLIIPIMFTAGCLNSPDDNGGPAPGDPYKIGVILPLTGYISFIAEDMKKGMDLAAKEINDEGGIDGHKIVLVYEDSKLDPTQTISVMKKLTQVDGVPIVIGAVASTNTIPIVSMAEEEKVVLLSAASTHSELSGSSKYFFRVVPSDAIQGPESARIAYETLGAKKVAIIYENNDYGVGLKKLFEKEFKSKGGQIVGTPESYESGATSFSTQVAKTLSANPDLIYLPGYPREQAQVIRELDVQGFTGKILASEAFETKEVFAVGGDAVDGVFLMKPDSDRTRKVYQDFSTAFKAKYNEDPGSFSDYAYDAIMVAAQSIKDAGYDGAKIKTNMATAKFTNTATREIEFNDQGDVTTGTYNLFVAKVSDQSFTPYGV